MLYITGTIRVCIYGILLVTSRMLYSILLVQSKFLYTYHILLVTTWNTIEKEEFRMLSIQDITSTIRVCVYYVVLQTTKYNM